MQSVSHRSKLVIVPAQGAGPSTAAASLKTIGEEEEEDEDGVRYYSKSVEHCNILHAVVDFL